MIRRDCAHRGGGPAESPLALEQGNARELLAMPMMQVPSVTVERQVMVIVITSRSFYGATKCVSSHHVHLNTLRAMQRPVRILIL